jgi:hypothetical protein
LFKGTPRAVPDNRTARKGTRARHSNSQRSALVISGRVPVYLFHPLIFTGSLSLSLGIVSLLLLLVISPPHRRMHQSAVAWNYRSKTLKHGVRELVGCSSNPHLFIIIFLPILSDFPSNCVLRMGISRWGCRAVSQRECKRDTGFSFELCFVYEFF